MIQLQCRYAWVQHAGHDRLLHVEREEPGDVRTMPMGGWIAFAQATRSEAQMDYDGVRYPPDRILEELESRRFPHRFDKELALVLVSVSRFQEFMRTLVLDRESITEEIRSQLLLDRRNRLYPEALEPKVTKVKKHTDRPERHSPTLDEKPLPLPVFSVHPGASVDQWGPLLQTGMINEAFRALAFYSHDCDLDVAIQEDYRFINVLLRDKPFYVTKNPNWPKTKCRILVASKALSTSSSAVKDRWTIPSPSKFLIVDNYLYRDVRQITLLILTSTQVPFFRSGIAPQTMTLVRKARSDLHQKGAKIAAKDTVSSPSVTDDFSSKPQILPPYGDWEKNPAVISWLAECSQRKT